MGFQVHFTWHLIKTFLIWQQQRICYVRGRLVRSSREVLQSIQRSLLQWSCCIKCRKNLLLLLFAVVWCEHFKYKIHHNK